MIIWGLGLERERERERGRERDRERCGSEKRKGLSFKAIAGGG